jgi:hypothetical protein
MLLSPKNPFMAYKYTLSPQLYVITAPKPKRKKMPTKSVPWYVRAFACFVRWHKVFVVRVRAFCLNNKRSQLEETVILYRQMSEDRKRPLEDDDYDDEGEENGEDEDDKGEEEGEEDTNDDSREMSMRRGFLCPNSPHVCLFVCLDVVFNLIRLMWMAICCGKAFEL